MKKTRILSTTLITLASILAVVFCVLMGVFFTNKTSRPNNSNPNLDAAAPEGNWVDYAVQPATGSGTQSDPWHIKTAAELAYVAKTAVKDSNFYIYLDVDIDLGAHQWSAIGYIPLDDGDSVNGIHMYGQNHTISNMYVGDSSAYTTGLMAGVTNCEIRDINFENAQVISTYHAGVAVAYATNLICENVNVLSGSITDGERMGGMVGYVASSASIQNCTNNATISGTVHLGGIVGWGSGNATTIQNCVNTGSITGNKNVGGIAGKADALIINDCVNKGKIIGTLDSAGGIVGMHYGNIQNCVNKGEVNGVNYVGGISGSNSSSGSEIGTTINCINMGVVTGTSRVDGISGGRYGKIIDCYSVEGNWTDYAVEPAVGSGTEADPWHIYSAEELAYLAATATSSSNFYLYLEADINLVEHFWVPIGSLETPIKSIHLYGQKHLISNMFINFEGDCALGLVGMTIDGINISSEIRDLNFKNSDISCGDDGDCIYTGTVVGFSGNVLFENINIQNGNVCINSDISPMENYLGGIVGYSEGHTIIQNCTYSGVVAGFDCVGGIIGGTGTLLEIINCNTYGKISGGVYIGGIGGWLGLNHNSQNIIQNCNNYAEITGSSDYVGGIAGNAKCEIQNCNNYGSVSGKSYLGGIAGNSSAEIANCYNKGIVTGTSYLGGIAGQAVGEIQNCTNSGVVGGNNTSFVGGIAGQAVGEIQNCTNSGVVGGNNTSFVGGIAGDSKALIINCTNTGDATGVYCGGITSRTTANIEGCYNSGTIFGIVTAGIVGQIVVKITIKNCTNSGHIGSIYVTGRGGYGSGGIVGNISNYGAIIQNCINIGDLEGTNQIGGIVGYVTANVSISNCYNGGDISGSARAGGIVGNINGTSGLSISRCYNSGSLIMSSTNAYVGGIAGYSPASGTLPVEDCVFIGEILTSSTTHAAPLVNGGATYASCYYDIILKTSATTLGRKYKGYVLGTDTEATAFSRDIWVLNSSTEFTSMPVPKSLAWVGEYLENNQNILQFLKDNGFTAAAA